MAQPVLIPVEVFTPNDFPVYTYVNRATNPSLEQQLKQALATPKEVVSISGPSKSGKTVLIEQVVGSDNLITVSGSEIDNATSLWDRVLDWIGVPLSGITTSAKASTGGLSSQVGEAAASHLWPRRQDWSLRKPATRRRTPWLPPAGGRDSCRFKGRSATAHSVLTHPLISVGH
jgi:hypothetical protein